MHIDHIGFGVRDFQKSKEFYLRVLAPLGLKIVKEGDGWVSIGKTSTVLWIGEHAALAKDIHLAFVADTHEQVDAFYAAAIENGAKDNGKPGLCPEYDPNYYAGFVIDLNGIYLEAVCRK